VTVASAPLCAYLLTVCDRADTGLQPGAAKNAIAGVRERLREDVLRVAVGGRLNAGKSTLVNALLGEKLAATDATECTTLVTRFRFGPVNRISIQVRDGEMITLPAQPLANAVTAVGRPIASVCVESSNAILANDYTIVDTPGLDSLSGLDGVSLSALSEADVLLYLMPHPGENDREVLEALTAAASQAGISAVTTIGVLSRVDQLGDGTGDPWPVATRLATRGGKQFAAILRDVVPVVGLLAETALGDTFTEADMIPLRALAGTDPEVLAEALYTADDFRTCPTLRIGTEDRARLYSLLGSYGIRVAVREINQGTRGAAVLLRALRSHSGIDTLLGQLRRQFLSLADPLRARRALQALDSASWLGTTPAETAILTALRNDLDRVRSDPRLRQLGLIEAVADLNAGCWQATPEMTRELTALATGADPHARLGIDPATAPGQIRTLLGTRIAAWRTLEYTSPRATARYAGMVREQLESLLFALPSAPDTQVRLAARLPVTPDGPGRDQDAADEPP
jgi:hypothetical protein